MTTPTLASTISALCPLACALALSACIEADTDTDLDTGADQFRVTDYDCPRWRCGYNTSEINGKSVQELHLDGDSNAEGVSLVGFLPPLGLLLNWELDVEGDALVARGGLLGNSTLSGPGLVGSTLLLDIGEGLVVPVIIAGYEEVDSWSSNADPVAAYSLVYADLDDPQLQHSVCKGTLIDPLQASVVILAGERYDGETKTVIGGQDGWFTLACAGSAAAKMALMGYGPHADFDGQGNAATQAQRQATIKMLTGDYCGEGESYTEDGTPLDWENQAGTVVPDALPDPSALEAIWTSEGALCLDTPRSVDPDEVACALPSCDGFGLDDGEWASYVVSE